MPFIALFDRMGFEMLTATENYYAGKRIITALSFDIILEHS